MKPILAVADQALPPIPTPLLHTKMVGAGRMKRADFLTDGLAHMLERGLCLAVSYTHLTLPTICSV